MGRRVGHNEGVEERDGTAVTCIGKVEYLGGIRMRRDLETSTQMWSFNKITSKLQLRHLNANALANGLYT